jgi:hypothetical protein
MQPTQARKTLPNGNPQITFFKAVYRRHTNSLESIEQTFSGTVGFGKK